MGQAKPSQRTFLENFGIGSQEVVCLIGAGGKTSLMFHLAKEARQRGDRVLVTTSTRLQIPQPSQYDEIDLSGEYFENQIPRAQKIYVAGIASSVAGKMRGVEQGLDRHCRERFDCILIEGDGAARKNLKGWRDSEPVVPDYTTHTIGVVDIQTVGKIIDDNFIHRLDRFLDISGAEKGERVRTTHLGNLIRHERGLFAKGTGTCQLYINKVETEKDLHHFLDLKSEFSDMRVTAGSVHKGLVWDFEFEISQESKT